MKKTILILTLAAFAFAPVLRAEGTKYPPINPALLYWQAAAELPQLTEDQARDLSEMASGKLPFDAEKAGQLLTPKGSLRLAEKAANSTASCDWGLPLEDGPGTSLPHLAKIRQLAGLAIINAETLFAKGKVKEGVEWLMVAHRIARHAGAGDLLISFLVQNAIETNAVRAAARHCLSWDDGTRQAYAAALQTLPPLRTVQESFHGEQVLIDWVERRALPSAQSQHEIEELMQALTIEKPADKEAMIAQLAPGALPATLTEWRDLQSRLEAALGKPWAQGQPEIKALTDEAVHSPRYLIRNYIPTVTSVSENAFILATLHTMLQAALQHGSQLDEAAAGAYRDALEGEPLRLQKGENGTLTLLAARQHPVGKNLSLQLGK